MSRLVHDRLCRRSLRVRNLGVGPIRRGLAHEFDLIGRLICRGGVRIGQTQLTILRLHMPWAGLQGVRAQRPTLCRFGPDLTHGHVRVGDLCLAVPGSHRELPGDPGGALHGPRTVPTARRREIPISGGGEGVNQVKLGQIRFHRTTIDMPCDGSSGGNLIRGCAFTPPPALRRRPPKIRKSVKSLIFFHF